MLKLMALGILLSSCAIKHHVQVGDIERVPGKKLVPFKLLVSQTGVNLKEGASIISGITRDNGRASQAAEIISLFQMGPRTGQLVFNEKYADVVPKLITAKCPSGKVTGLLMLRETNKYPVVSGEIIKITGYCVK